MPPTGQQLYHQQPVPGGQTQPAYFQYSQCNGRKKALLVGFDFELLYVLVLTISIFTGRHKLCRPA